MLYRLFAAILLAILALPCRAQQAGFTSSHLPIVVVETGGQTIPNEPKITAQMRVIDNGPGQTNHVTDPPNGYDGLIGIEVRGASSQTFPKKQYAVETRDADGENRNVSLLGLPEENDWVLYAPYSDKSLLRNVLAYETARRMGRYASRARFCELVLDGDYRGVYVLLEKIKQDKNRVAVAGLDPDDTSGDKLTGGYILKVDKWEGSDNEGWPSKVRPAARPGSPVYYQYHDPSPEDLAPEQKAYIRAHLGAFEDVMAGPGYADPEAGYPAWIDVGSFVDYLILNELSRNVDGYRLSAFFYKNRDSRDGRLVMGPAWDYNLAFGNADYYDGAARAGWQFDFAEPADDFQPPFWWGRLLDDAAFRSAVAERWRTLRRGPLHPDTLSAFVDAQVEALGDAAGRNFARWPVLSQYVWPNAYVGGSYASEVDYLKRWTRERAAWIDAHVDALRPLNAGTPPAPAARGFALAEVHPNPATTAVSFVLTVETAQVVRVDVYDPAGRRVRASAGQMLGPGRHTFRYDLSGLSSGLYYVRASGERTSGERAVATRSFVVVR